MSSGKRRDRIAFDKRATVTDDGYGNTVGGWEQQFVRWAELTPIRRGESVIASRLTGVQPYAVKVLSDSGTREITTEWRARDVRSDRVFNIRTVEPGSRRDEINMLCEEGVAHG